MLKHYEIMTITTESDPSVKKTLTDLGAKVTKEDDWGMRKFAYEIKHKTEASYNVMEFDLDSSKLIELKVKLNFLGNVVRYLILSIDLPVGTKS